MAVFAGSRGMEHVEHRKNTYLDLDRGTSLIVTPHDRAADDIDT